jgi:hypothetical protein
MRGLLLIAMLVLLQGRSEGQTIPLDSFFVPGASWTEVVHTVYYPCSSGPTVHTFGLVYKVERDTMISGRVYHLLSYCHKGGYGYSSNCASPGGSNTASAGGCGPIPEIFAMIRTDSERVYFTLLKKLSGPLGNYYCDTVGHEYLFYDYNLSLGSVVPATTLIGGITVTDVDSVSLSNGVYVKRYNNRLIYAIGDKDGFVTYWNLYICGPGPSAEQFLLCYDNPRFNYHLTYPAGTLKGNLQNDCFDMVTYLQTNEVPTIVASQVNSIYPNPVTDKLNITSNDIITSVSIISPAGRVYYAGDSNSNEVQLDVAALPAGIYFVKINGADVRRFVKH